VLAFAVTIGWNVIGLPFTGDPRDLGPLARAVAEQVGDSPFVLYHPQESLLGALPFYAGRIPPYSHELAAIAPLLDRSGARFVLAPISAREELARALGGRAALVATWKAVREEYGLFAVAPAVPASPLASDPTGLTRR